jgi:tripartite-type tricarboxylate transporter receptor subunit TctC
MGATRLFAFALAAAIIAVARPASADAIEDFYKKTDVRLVIGIDAGGSYDTTGRLVGRFIGRHIPGNPRVVPQNMPGASSRVATNYVYNVAPKDGSIIAAVAEGIPLSQAMGEQGVRYDAAKFNWIGTPEQPVSILSVWYTSGIKTFEDTRTKETTIGATSVTGTNFVYPTLAKNLLGAKFKIVVGYSGGNAINLAMERGEVAGRGSQVWSLIKRERPDWIAQKKLIVIAQMSLDRHPDLQDVPRLVDLAQTDDAHKALEAMAESDAMGRPLVSPPGVAADKIAVLRKAFDETMKDPDFLAEADKMGEEIRPTSGERLQEIAKRILASEPRALEILKVSLSGQGFVDCDKFTDPKYCTKDK